jgi:hypothetical protein
MVTVQEELIKTIDDIKYSSLSTHQLFEILCIVKGYISMFKKENADNGVKNRKTTQDSH